MALSNIAAGETRPKTALEAIAGIVMTQLPRFLDESAKCLGISTYPFKAVFQNQKAEKPEISAIAHAQTGPIYVMYSNSECDVPFVFKKDERGAFFFQEDPAIDPEKAVEILKFISSKIMSAAYTLESGEDVRTLLTQIQGGKPSALKQDAHKTAPLSGASGPVAAASVPPVLSRGLLWAAFDMAAQKAGKKHPEQTGTLSKTYSVDIENIGKGCSATLFIKDRNEPKLAVMFGKHAALFKLKINSADIQQMVFEPLGDSQEEALTPAVISGFKSTLASLTAESIKCAPARVLREAGLS